MNPTIIAIYDFCGLSVIEVRDVPGTCDTAKLKLVVGGSHQAIKASPERWFEVSHPVHIDRKGVSVRRRAQPPGESASTRSYLVMLDPLNGIDREVDPVTTVTIQQGAKAVAVYRGRAEPITLERLSDAPFRDALCKALKAGGRPDIATIFERPVLSERRAISDDVQMDECLHVGGGFVVSGWTRHAPKNLFVATGDLRHWSNVSASVPHHTILDETRANASSSQAPREGQHFTAVIPYPHEEAPQDFYLIAQFPASGETVFHGPFMVECVRDDDKAFTRVRTAFGDIRSLSANHVDQIYRPILSLPPREVRAHRLDFGPAPEASGEGIASIVIPFYGDPFFIACVHHLQKTLDRSFELILVVDDPRIGPQIHQSLATRSTSITVPTVLLQCAENYGYGRANNLGCAVARGDVLFLMNSDILVTDPQGLRVAAEEIRAHRGNGADVIVGFSLLYEDASIQHLGMEFKRSPLVGNMYIANHPKKGLPMALDVGPERRQVPAVTGALMGLSAELYRRLGGFDPVFGRGDFEDADLCLRAQQLGATIELHVRPGLYHLERQSIPAMGGAGFREAVTYLNCAEFNRRWDALLAERATSSLTRNVPATPARSVTVRKRALG